MSRHSPQLSSPLSGLPRLALLLALAACGETPEEPADPVPEPVAFEPAPRSAEPAGHEVPEPADDLPVTYDLVPEESLLYVVVRRDPDAVGSGLSHDHAVRATGWEGTVVLDRGRIERSRVELSIPVGRLSADEAQVRERAGLDGQISRSDREEIEASMRDEDQLDEENHPTIRFESTRVSLKEDGTLLVDGVLTIRGKGRETSVEVEYRAGEGSFEARGRFTAEHADFGFEPYTALLGALRNAEEIEFVFEARGKAR